MKADDRWFEMLQYIGSFDTERGPRWGSWYSSEINSVLFVVRRKRHSPCRFTLDIERRCRVAKEIHVEGFVSTIVNRGQLATHGIYAEHSAG